MIFTLAHAHTHTHSHSLILQAKCAAHPLCVAVNYYLVTSKCFYKKKVDIAFSELDGEGDPTAACYVIEGRGKLCLR